MRPVLNDRFTMSVGGAKMPRLGPLGWRILSTVVHKPEAPASLLLLPLSRLAMGPKRFDDVSALQLSTGVAASMIRLPASRPRRRR